MHEISIPRKQILSHRLIYLSQNMSRTLRENLTIPFLIIDFILVNIAFFSMNYIKRNTLELDVKYLKLLMLFYLVWTGISYFTKKYKLSSYPDYKHAFLLIAKSNVFILYSLSLVIVLQGLYAFSRVQLFGTCLILFALELIVFSIFYLTTGKDIIRKNRSDQLLTLKFKNFSLFRFVTDISLVGLSFFVLNFYKRSTLELSPIYEELFLVVFALWVITSLFTKKYERIKTRNYYYAIAPYVKSFALTIALSSVIVFAFRMFFYSRLQIFGTFALTFIIESFVLYIYYKFKSQTSSEHDIETIQEVHQLIEQENLPFELDKIQSMRNRDIVSVKEKLKTKFLKKYPKQFKFINEYINLLKIDEMDTCVLNTHTMYNIQTIEDHTVSLFINLHKINDIRYLNRYFLEIHRKIYNGGFLVGKVDTIVTHRTTFYKKFSKTIAQIMYPVYFLIKRVFPKLPGIQKIYFLITNGRNRALSKAETLGRLYFCGFRIIKEEEIDGSLYFIAQRVKHPSIEKNPSYGPTIQLKRVGLNGDILYVNKFRTMHPYSEFLQEYIYENNKLQENGKFKNDFRLTEWGQLMRRLWIDELPQFLNFWRGDLNLVGVRALSQHYYNLYPDDLKKFRIQFKPGLVPPYYADMPESFEEIVESEREYLIQKQKHPFKTDVRYFTKAFYNIIFKRARSQ